MTNTTNTTTTARTNADLSAVEIEVFKAISIAKAEVNGIALLRVNGDSNAEAVADKAAQLLDRLRKELAEFARNLPKNPAA